jgi:hypothetical protein
MLHSIDKNLRKQQMDYLMQAIDNNKRIYKKIEEINNSSVAAKHFKIKEAEEDLVVFCLAGVEKGGRHSFNSGIQFTIPLNDEFFNIILEKIMPEYIELLEKNSKESIQWHQHCIALEKKRLEEIKNKT